MNTRPAFFVDSDEMEWTRNMDGTYRCLHAEIRSMSFEEIEKEFGPLSF